MSNEVPRCLGCLAHKRNAVHQRYPAGWYAWFSFLSQANPHDAHHDCGAHDVDLAAALLRRDAR